MWHVEEFHAMLQRLGMLAGVRAKRTRYHVYVLFWNFKAHETATNMHSILRHGHVCVLAAVPQCAILSKLMPYENDSPCFHVSNSHKTLHTHADIH